MSKSLFHSSADISLYDIGTLLKPESAGIDTHIIQTGVSPLSLAVIIVIGLMAPGPSSGRVGRIRFVQPFFFHDAAYFIFLVGQHKESYHSLVVFKYCLRAPPYDHK